VSREAILAEMRRTAEENQGRPLGVARFEQVTGIRPYDWGKYWARFGDVVREAGLEPNTLNAPLPEVFLLDQLIGLIREIGAFPTFKEMRLKRERDAGFPHAKVFGRFGRKNELIGAVLAFARDNPDLRDIVELCAPLHRTEKTEEGFGHGKIAPDSASGFGFVYLARGHPGEYKIGRTNLVDRRLPELGITASVELELVHTIQTDDPVGVEAYWHGRFEKLGKRMRGEWFRLRAEDVAAFRRWRRIF
jgi:Meiotically up-regulated gene 113